MKFFLDTADIKEIKKYASWGIIDGVTTNPSLIAKENVDLEKRIKEIAEIIDGPISTEVIAQDTKGMLEEARKFADWHPNIYIKIPMTIEGLQAIKILSNEGIKTNVTLIFSLPQAIMAAKAGASIVSPFVGRLDDISFNGMKLIEDLVKTFNNYKFETEILVASIRHPIHVNDSATMGAHIVTMPPEVLNKLIKHPLSDIGIQKFLEDWKSCCNHK